MKVSELYEWLMQSCDRGFGKAEVLVCDKGENPITDGWCVCNALRIEGKDGEKHIVLQTD